ncbi:MAG: hypothetical protein JO112_18040, partial [Planctomycetes bacterium]|nr:hypothetical protein [Planctomycetota bacterium]
MIQKTTWDSRGDNQGFIKWFLGLATFLLGLTPLSAEAASPARPILSGLKNPTAVAVGSDNRVYIATAGEFGKPGDGAVFVLEGAKAVPFAAGLDDPIALAGWGEWLYVADQNRVWRLNRQGKKEVYAAADAFPGRQGTFLGLDVDEEGRLYVSASGLEGKDGAIYRIDPKGKVDVVTRDMPSSALKMPGRLAMDGYSFLLVVDPMTGLLLRLKLADGTTTKLADSLVAGGLAWDKFGRLFLSDAKSGRLLAIPRPGEKPVLLASGLHPASGICVDPAGRFVLVPDTHAG